MQIRIIALAKVVQERIPMENCIRDPKSVVMSKKHCDGSLRLAQKKIFLSTRIRTLEQTNCHKLLSQCAKKLLSKAEKFILVPN